MRSSPLSARIVCLAFGLALVATAGCGSSHGKLTGKVTYQNNPLKGGTVTFVPIGDGKSFSTTINEDGTYTVDQIDSGKYRVCVETASLKSTGSGYGPPGMVGGKSIANVKNKAPEGANMPEGYKMVDPGAGAAERAKRYVAIPQNYASPTDSPLTVEVKGGSQTHDIPLS